MGNKNIIIRPVQEKDVKNIWLIRNHLAVRRNSNNPQKIYFTSHKIWFENKYYKNNDNKCFILEKDRQVIGYCRFDLEKNKYLVSIAIAPTHHGLGFGSILLAKSLNLLKTKKEILAEIKRENSASIKMFLKDDFEIYHQDPKIFYLKYSGQNNSLRRDLIKLYYLVQAQILRKSNALVWLQGDRYDRAEKVLELYKKAWAQKIVITGNNILIGKNKKIEENNISIEDMAEWLIKRGVRKQDLIIDKSSLNTKKQAEYVIHLAKDRSWKSIILIGSSYYQPRAFLTFLEQARKSGWRGKIINQPTQVAWHKIPGGRKKFAWQYFKEETVKIKKYKKDLARVADGIKYLNNLTI